MPKNETSYKRYSLRKILFNDYFSFLAWMFPVVIFGMALFIEIFGFFPDLKRGRPPLGTDAIPFFIQLGIIIIIVGIIVIFIRTVLIKSYFQKGKEVHGEITGFWRPKSYNGRIYFKYKFEGMEFNNSMVVYFGSIVRSYSTKDKVRVLV